MRSLAPMRWLISILSLLKRRSTVLKIMVFAIQTLVQTSLRSIIGEMDLDDALSSRDHIKARLKAMISDDIADWGITLKNRRNTGHQSLLDYAGCHGRAGCCRAWTSRHGDPCKG